MDSDLHYRHHYQQQRQQDYHQPQQNMINSGMYGGEVVTPLFNPPVSRPESERILSRFMSGDGDGGGGGDNLSSHQNLGRIRGDKSHFMNSRKQEQQHMMYQNLAQSQQIVHNNNSIVSGSSSTTVDRLMAMDPATNLLRQSSSPAGFLAHMNIYNGYSMMRSMDKLRPANGSVPDSSFSSANRLKSPMAFSSGSRSSSRLLSTMAHNNGGFGETCTIGSWDESSMLTDGFMKELRETDQITSCGNQDEGEIYAPTGLTHQLSLPTSSTELSVMANLLQFQDNVPLRSRAKRGCATHPRSIAERVRRTRISERMRKLQDLVPNMDKQTSIADMLDLPVDYIKDLKTQVETLSDHHAKCTCPNKQKL